MAPLMPFLSSSFVFFSVIRLYCNEAVGEEEGNYVFKMSSAPLWKAFFFFFFFVMWQWETLLENGTDYSPQGWLLGVIADWKTVQKQWSVKVYPFMDESVWSGSAIIHQIHHRKQETQSPRVLHCTPICPLWLRCVREQTEDFQLSWECLPREK